MSELISRAMMARNASRDFTILVDPLVFGSLDPQHLYEFS